VVSTFRVKQIEGLFGLASQSVSRETFSFSMPDPNGPWQIGAIVGHSGSGKTTLAQSAFGSALINRFDWPTHAALVDGFEPGPIHRITRALCSVGLGSPPLWLRPYATLSRGEQFRADLARALLAPEPLIVFDEFASPLDPMTAGLAALALQRAIRGGAFGKRFVAVTCHPPAIPFLQPDWSLETSTGHLTTEPVARPELTFEVVPAHQSLWRYFSEFHYLPSALSPFSQCWLARWQGQPAAFCAVLHSAGYHKRKRISRIVVRPEFQGIGLGRRFLEHIAEHYHSAGHTVSLTTSHPAMVSLLRTSERWQVRETRPIGNAPQRSRDIQTCSWGRPVVSGIYLGPPTEDDVLTIQLRCDVPKVTRVCEPFTAFAY
jgi:GNAT superfamily N-acetyltransferase